MNLLLVPIRIDALVLDKDQAVVGPLVDFAKMPFVTPRTMKDWDNRSLEVGVEVNGSRPFLSGELLTEPLADASLTLKRGVHLHWSLPAMLTQALPKPHGAPAGAAGRVDGADREAVGDHERLLDDRPGGRRRSVSLARERRSRTAHRLLGSLGRGWRPTTDAGAGRRDGRSRPVDRHRARRSDVRGVLSELSNFARAS